MRSALVEQLWVGSLVTALGAALMTLPALTVNGVAIWLFPLPLLFATRFFPTTAIALLLPLWVLLAHLLLGATALIVTALVVLILGCAVLASWGAHKMRMPLELSVAVVSGVLGLVAHWFSQGEITSSTWTAVAGWLLSVAIAMLCLELTCLSPRWRKLTTRFHGGDNPTRPTLLQLSQVVVALTVAVSAGVALATASANSAPQLILLEVSVGLLLLIIVTGVIDKIVAPVLEVADAFEQWRRFDHGEAGSGAALQAARGQNFSSFDDIYTLQIRLQTLARAVLSSERRLSTIAANYDELLRSLPLGVLAVDGAGRVQFLNDSLGEMTEHRHDALALLKSKASDMLANSNTFTEWQLVTEGMSPRHLLLVVTHRLDERGQGSGLWAIATDITQQKQTSAQLVQASKLATLGEMSTGMAHELNQPLNVISLAVSNLRFTLSKSDEQGAGNALAKLERIDNAVKRAAGIIDHMRAYGRLSGEGLADISLPHVVDGVCKLMQEQLKLINIQLVNHVEDETLWVAGNAIQLEQVLINLVTNARDAISEGPGRTGAITIDAVISGNRAHVRVTDDGGGIPEDVLPHVFEPFFTTKPVGKGTGLGGSISYGIIREMQGDIWAENVSKGARITISLPLLQKQPQIASAVLRD